MNRVYALAFNELYVAKIWSKAKNCEYVKEYIPDYSEDQQHERDQLLNIKSTGYPYSVFKMIESAYSKRKHEEYSESKDLIKITRR